MGGTASLVGTGVVSVPGGDSAHGLAEEVGEVGRPGRRFQARGTLHVRPFAASRQLCCDPGAAVPPNTLYRPLLDLAAKN